MQAYMEKALREAKRTTNWIEPDEAHEAGVQAFVAALYEHDAFPADFEPFAAELALAGDRAALAQLLLKLTVPGLPDIDQGDELLSLSLVDPDNRRPVDWEERRRALDELRRGAAPSDRTRKLWLIMRALVLRRTRAAAFAGAYEPLDAGPRTVAFLRGGDVLVAAAVRGDGDPVELPSGRWRDVLHGGESNGGDHVDLRDGIALFEQT
jgi:(1->4)-alpha-D-glucan 1-alpha-D-glucosylmutase